jgi:HEPN domain-containing protein
MTNASLARSYLKKASARHHLLSILQEKRAYSDVIREAQEVVELALKGMLRQVGVEPPKWHDVGELLIEHRARFAEKVALRIPRLAETSGWLRGERELSFYGDIDFIPTEQYTREDGLRAISEAGFALQTARWVIMPRPSKSRT